VAAADADNGLTALQEYVNRPDAHYKWTYMPENNLVGDGFTAYMVRKQRRNNGTGHPRPRRRDWQWGEVDGPTPFPQFCPLRIFAVLCCCAIQVNLTSQKWLDETMVNMPIW
jgi:hypothetical protein